MPILGSMLYFLVGNKQTGKKLKNKLEKSSLMLTDMLSVREKEYIAGIKEQDLRIGQTLEHLSLSTGFPVLKNDTSKYYPFGEEMFQDMCEDLKKAEK